MLGSLLICIVSLLVALCTRYLHGNALLLGVAVYCLCVAVLWFKYGRNDTDKIETFTDQFMHYDHLITAIFLAISEAKVIITETEDQQRSRAVDRVYVATNVSRDGHHSAVIPRSILRHLVDDLWYCACPGEYTEIQPTQEEEEFETIT